MTEGKPMRSTGGVCAPDEQNRRILVIDDNPSIHEDVRKILAAPAEQVSALTAFAAHLFDEPAAVDEKPFDIASAFQGNEGLTMLETALDGGQPYALAFVDVRMPPGWDGIETIRRLWERDPDLQVVICSAFSDYNWAEIMGRLGPAESLLILRKPFDEMELRQIAHALASKWTLHRQSRHRLESLEGLVSQRTQELESMRRLTGRIARELAQLRREAPLACEGTLERLSTIVRALEDLARPEGATRPKDSETSAPTPARTE
jgi:CheY-like chemotaxis protein